MTAGRKSVTSKKNWGTPRVYVDAVREAFAGRICLDPCSNRHSLVGADVEYALPVHDGLAMEWDYPTIYVNPPYGVDKKRRTRIGDWLRKCADANEAYGSEVQALVPVATNTAHWKRYVFGRADAVCFLADTRLRFLVDGRDGGKGAPMACAMVYWGRNRGRFCRVFRRHGAVVHVQRRRPAAPGRGGRRRGAAP